MNDFSFHIPSILKDCLKGTLCSFSINYFPDNYGRVSISVTVKRGYDGRAMVFPVVDGNIDSIEVEHFIYG